MLTTLLYTSEEDYNEKFPTIIVYTNKKTTTTSPTTIPSK